MSLDVYLSKVMITVVFEANMTHNLAGMAKEAGIYEHLWYPEELGIEKASQLIEPLKEALSRMREQPERFKKFNPENEWGTYEGFVAWVERYLAACIEDPNCNVEVSR